MLHLLSQVHFLCKFSICYDNWVFYFVIFLLSLVCLLTVLCSTLCYCDTCTLEPKPLSILICILCFCYSCIINLHQFGSPALATAVCSPRVITNKINSKIVFLLCVRNILTDVYGKFCRHFSWRPLMTSLRTSQLAVGTVCSLLSYVHTLAFTENAMRCIGSYSNSFTALQCQYTCYEWNSLFLQG